MNMQFSFSNKFQYENNLNGYTSTVSITEPQVAKHISYFRRAVM